MTILAIDPGTTESGYVLYSPDLPTPVADFGKVDNLKMLSCLQGLSALENVDLAIEMVASYGMPVGREVFETCVWIGRFIQAWEGRGKLTRKTRAEIKMHLCHRTQGVNDSVIRRRLIDLFPATGKDSKGNPNAIGTKKYPGPLYGVKADAWQALALALTVAGAKAVA